MQKQEQKKGKGMVWYWTIIAVVIALMLCIQPTHAAEPETIWERFSTIMRDFYDKILAISTLVAVVMSAVALIVRMTSRNQKAVDEATAWLKRILISWIILNTLGLIVAYLQPLIAGGQFLG